MQNTNSTTLPIDIAFVRDIAAALSGTSAADFDAADFAALPVQCQVTSSFGISQDSDDIKQAVNSAWPYPASASHAGAIVVIRGNGMDMARYKAIQGELRDKIHDTSLLLTSFCKCTTLPPGAVSIIILAIARNRVEHPQ